MVNNDLLKFIREARRRGFSDGKIKEVLLSNGWPASELTVAFDAIKSEHHTKHSVSIWLADEILRKLEKRAKKNLMTLPEQIEDILRRSVINAKGITSSKEKLDDILVGLFSRKRRK